MKIPFVLPSKHMYVSTTRIKPLMLFRKTVTVCCEILKKYKSTLYELNAILMN
jgi:hypothetical protein